MNDVYEAAWYADGEGEPAAKLGESFELRDGQDVEVPAGQTSAWLAVVDEGEIVVMHLVHGWRSYWTADAHFTTLDHETRMWFVWSKL